MSAGIQRESANYHKVLEQTQKGTTDITRWLEWYLHCFTLAIESAEHSLDSSLNKAYFWNSIEYVLINNRQRHTLNLLLDGFHGKLTAVKWATVNNSSHDTALRDIPNLIDKGILIRDVAGGRSTSYSLKV